jgi:hypothetical protein
LGGETRQADKDDWIMPCEIALEELAHDPLLSSYQMQGEGREIQKWELSMPHLPCSCLNLAGLGMGRMYGFVETELPI